MGYRGTSASQGATFARLKIMGWVDVIELVRANPPTKKEMEQVMDYRRRRAKPKFYADENFPSRAARLLRQRGGRVLTAQDAGMAGHPDEDHVAFALRGGYILLTCDRDYLNERRFPLIHCPAIVVFDFGAGSREEISNAFICLQRMFGSPQFFDK